MKFNLSERHMSLPLVWQKPYMVFIFTVHENDHCVQIVIVVKLDPFKTVINSQISETCINQIVFKQLLKFVLWSPWLTIRTWPNEINKNGNYVNHLSKDILLKIFWLFQCRSHLYMGFLSVFMKAWTGYLPMRKIVTFITLSITRQKPASI